MKYYITDGNKYIYKNITGKYVCVPNIDMADTYDKDEAKKILHNQIAKKIRKNMKIIPAMDEVVHIKEDHIVNKTLSKVTKEDLSRAEIKASENENIKKWLAAVGKFDEAFKEMHERRQELDKQQSIMTKAENFLCHYAWQKNGNFTPEEALTFVNDLGEVGLKRNQIKDEIKVLNSILSSSSVDINKVNKVVDGLDNRVYTPDMFDDMIDNLR